MSIRVIRIGGSLLTWNPFQRTFERWLAAQSPSHNVLVVGGGPWVELLRQATKRFDIDEDAAHVLCLKALSTTANLLSEVLSCPVVQSVDALQSPVHSANPIVFNVYDHLESVDRSSESPLPRTWDVTSDSIAARIARDVGACELVLLKSADCPIDDPHDRRRLSELGYVDAFFPIASQGQLVRFVNLRSESATAT